MDLISNIPRDIYKLLVLRLDSEAYVSLMSASSVNKRRLLNLYNDEFFCSMRLPRLNLRDYDDNVKSSLICRVSDLIHISPELPMLLLNEDPRELCLAVSMIDRPLYQPHQAIEFLLFKHHPVLYSYMYTYCYSKALQNTQDNTITYKPYLKFVANNPKHLHRVIEACIDKDNYRLAYNLLLSLMPVGRHDIKIIKKLATVLYGEIRYYASYDLLCTLKGQLKKLDINVDSISHWRVWDEVPPLEIAYHTNKDHTIIEENKPYPLIYDTSKKELPKTREASYEEYKKLGFIYYELVPFGKYANEWQEAERPMMYSSYISFGILRYMEVVKGSIGSATIRWGNYRFLYIILRYKLVPSFFCGFGPENPLGRAIDRDESLS